jgi:hypothetical protein
VGSHGERVADCLTVCDQSTRHLLVHLLHPVLASRAVLPRVAHRLESPLPSQTVPGHARTACQAAPRIGPWDTRQFPRLGAVFMSRRRVGCVLVSVVLLAACRDSAPPTAPTAPTPAAPPTTNVVAGRVVDLQANRALSGVQLTWRPSVSGLGQVITTTNADGIYRVTLPLTDQYDVTLSVGSNGGLRVRVPAAFLHHGFPRQYRGVPYMVRRRPRCAHKAACLRCHGHLGRSAVQHGDRGGVSPQRDVSSASGGVSPVDRDVAAERHAP